jgi:protease II
MDVASRDLQINKLKEVILNRTNLLLHNSNEINKNINKNEMFKDIADEYKTYLSEYLREKEELFKLSNYIDSLAKENINNEKVLAELKQDQQRIFREIKNIENKMKIN